MEVLPSHPYLQFLPDTLTAVRRDIGLDKPGEMKEAVRILDEWVRQQNHFLKKDFSPVYLESTVVKCKGSLERAKRLLDKMCTLRTVLPSYFQPYDVKKEFQRARGSSYLVPLPQPTCAHRRVFAFKFAGKYGDPDLMQCLYRYVYSSVDFVKLHDYHSGVEIIYDVSELDVRDAIANVNLFELKNCYVSLSESYGMRIKVIRLITKSKLIDTLVAFFRQFLKKKIMDRLVVHSSITELHDCYPRELLPKDYGGTEKSLDELQGEFLELLSSEEYRQHLKSMSEAKIDEALRPADQFNDLYAGTYGTFRSLTLD